MPWPRTPRETLGGSLSPECSGPAMPPALDPKRAEQSGRTAHFRMPGGGSRGAAPPCTPPAGSAGLAEWRSRFLAAADQAGQLGFGPAFQRMWKLYLAYSEAGFRAGYLDVHQLILERRW